MAVAQLELDTSPGKFDSYYLKAADEEQRFSVYVASLARFSTLKKKLEGLPAIYILQAEDSTVYVGQSMEPVSRLSTHKANAKIEFTRVIVFIRDQKFATYLDYSEAFVYRNLKSLGYRLVQSDLEVKLEKSRLRLEAESFEYASIAEKLMNQFLAYAIALGLKKPHISEPGAALSGMPEASSKEQLISSKESVFINDIATSPLVAPANQIELSMQEAVSAKPRIKAAKTALRVTFADGMVIEEKKASWTLVKALETVGLEKVSSLGIVNGGHPLVSKNKSNISQHQGSQTEISGFWVITHSSTQTKKAQLDKIGEALSLGWIVDIV